MSEYNIRFKSGNNAIEIAYHIQDLDDDMDFLTKVLAIIVKNKLSCQILEDDYQNRAIYISGKNRLQIKPAYNELKKL